MALTFPRELPFSGSIFGPGSALEPLRSDAINQDRAGMVEVMELGDPLWKLRLVTKPLRVSQRAAWKAWASSLQGGVQLFWGYPPVQQYPLQYGVGALGLTRAGGGAFNGNASIGTPGTFSLPLSNLPAGYAASAGDWVSVALTTGGRMLHMVTETAGANGSGALNVSVTPWVRPETAANVATVQLVRPKGLFVLTSFNCSDGDVTASVSLEAVSTVRDV